MSIVDMGTGHYAGSQHLEWSVGEKGGPRFCLAVSVFTANAPCIFYYLSGFSDDTKMVFTRCHNSEGDGLNHHQQNLKSSTGIYVCLL
jgi:hypothetical protein